MANVITGKGIDAFRLLSIKHQLKLEKLGLKSSGGALRPRLAVEFGLKPRDSHDKFIAKIEGMLAEIKGG
jgi:hypothetical protein